MSVLGYLAALIRHCLDHGCELKELRKGQQQIMATLADVQAKLDAVTAAVGGFSGPLSAISSSVENIAADIQALKDQIGAGTPGITPEEADGVVSQLDTILGGLSSVQEQANALATSAQTVADGQ